MGESLLVPTSIAIATQSFLREQGFRAPDGVEGVVLWVGEISTGRVNELLIPEQDAGRLFFDVPLAERQRIARSLAGSGRALICQVHSHPGDAWHSQTDDERALPRRVGSLSLVIPDFARHATLLEAAALYRLSALGTWVAEELSAISIDG